MNKPRIGALTGFDLLLYAGVLWGWSTSWYAIKLQLGDVAPEVSVFWRFLVTAPLMALLARARCESLQFTLSQHAGLAAMGMLMFSTNFILFYRSGLYLPSGLLAVVFSLASLLNLVFGVALGVERLRWHLALGALMGVAGVMLMMGPQLDTIDAGSASLWGAGFAVAGTLCFTSGNQVSAAFQRRGIKVLPASAWAMVYGALWAGLLSLVSGHGFAVPMTPTYLGSFVFLVLSATILAFYSYLTLLGRIGAARASYATVIFPVIALLISAVLEDYRFTPAAIAGLVLALAGNVLVLRR